MTNALSHAIQLADDINSYPLGRCSPEDDPDKQYAYVSAFRDIAVRFVAAVKRIGDPDLSSLVVDLNAHPAGIVEAHDLRAELWVVIDALREAAQDPRYAVNVAHNAAFLNTDVLVELRAVQTPRLDAKKLVKMCEELNDNYARGNYISSALLLRTIINHVPPVFGVNTFAEVVANSVRSIKAILSHLNDEARPIADLHAHVLMRPKENLPTKNQLEPYKPSLEVLIQEVIGRLSNEVKY